MPVLFVFPPRRYAPSIEIPTNTREKCVILDEGKVEDRRCARGPNFFVKTYQ